MVISAPPFQFFCIRMIGKQATSQLTGKRHGRPTLLASWTALTALVCLCLSLFSTVDNRNRILRNKDEFLTFDDENTFSGRMSHGATSTAGTTVGNPESVGATVMGMATNLRYEEYRQFVGSLRKSGFSGQIILGIDRGVGNDIQEYLQRQNVKIKFVDLTTCTHPVIYKKMKHVVKDKGALFTCASAYSDVKLRWAKYPMGLDWLRECEACTGPVLLTDVRDVIFQGDPFGPNAPKVEGLQVFQEHPNQTTSNWVVDTHIESCKGVRLEKQMLCSGTTIGTLEAMMEYLETMYEEMKSWLADPNCRFNLHGGDQSIHNWLFYNGDLSKSEHHSVSIPPRTGIVNTVGKEVADIFRNRLEEAEGNNRTWISTKFGLTDEDGYFTNLDGSRSLVVHQFDRIETLIRPWMEKQYLFSDELESAPIRSL